MEGLERAAILLLSIGENNAAEVLKHVGHRRVQKLGNAMTSLEKVNQGEVDKIIKNFLDDFEQQTSLGVDSENYIRNALVTALGTDKANNLMDRIAMTNDTHGLDTLKWMDHKQIADLIRFEHPQIMAIVLTYLDSDKAAEVLKRLPEEIRVDILLRIASLDGVQPSALQELNSILEKNFSSNKNSKAASLGGTKNVAAIINNFDSTLEKQIMEELKEADDTLGEVIEDLMFVFEDLLSVDDRSIQTLLREVSTDNLIVALKAADDTMRNKFFSNMSKRAAELLKDDLEAKGPIKLSEVEAAQKEILSTARKMGEAGEISLGSKSGEEMV